MIKNDKLGFFLFGKMSIRIFLKKFYNLFLLCPLISISPALGSCCSHHVNVRSMTHACQIIQSLFNIKTLPPTDPLQTNILSPSSFFVLVNLKNIKPVHQQSKIKQVLFNDSFNISCKNSKPCLIVEDRSAIKGLKLKYSDSIATGQSI